MAEVAIPMAALGIMYIISNNNNNSNEDSIENYRNINELPDNLRTSKRSSQADLRDLKSNVVAYRGTKNNTDDFFKPQENKTNNMKAHQQEFESLSGKRMIAGNLQHNNMVPFFGSKVTQNSGDAYSSVLDLYTGSGNQTIKKKEQAPLFAPKKNMSHPYGAPNTNEFIKERMEANLTSKLSNNKPWESIQVGPGLNKGYSSQGSGGFNSGMESRKAWMPKSIDELRVASNPKKSYQGVTLGAYAGPGRTEPGKMGKMEKNKPDTYYINTPDRWFTTTGLEKAQKVRSTVVLQPGNRETTTKEYFGNSNQKEHTAPTQPGSFRKTRKTQWDSYNLGPAESSGSGDPHTKDYSKDSYTVLPNSRTFTGERTQLGVVSGSLKALFAPLMDVLKVSKKEIVIGNARPVGNVQGKNGVQNSNVWSPNDRPRTTIKEQTENNKFINHGYHYKEGGYTTNPQRAIYNQRDSTNYSNYGNPSASVPNPKTNEYNNSTYTHLNPNREIVSRVDRYNIGNQKLYNSNQNVTNLKNRMTKPSVIRATNLPKRSSNMSTIGKMSGKNTREVSMGCSRNDSKMVSAFNNNPYTHSLHSSV